MCIRDRLSAQLLQEGLQSFPGVKRRFTVEENGDNVYIDDYAHHPTAVKYMIEAARIKYPGDVYKRQEGVRACNPAGCLLFLRLEKEGAGGYFAGSVRC